MAKSEKSKKFVQRQQQGGSKKTDKPADQSDHAAAQRARPKHPEQEPPRGSPKSAKNKKP